MPRLDLKFVHRGHDLSVCNNIRGICLRSNICQRDEDSGEATSHVNLQLDFTEIHVCYACCLGSFPLKSIAFLYSAFHDNFPFQLLRDGASSVLEILKVAIITSVDIPMQVSYFIFHYCDLFFFCFSCFIFLCILC